MHHLNDRIVRNILLVLLFEFITSMLLTQEIELDTLYSTENSIGMLSKDGPNYVWNEAMPNGHLLLHMHEDGLDTIKIPATYTDCQVWYPRYFNNGILYWYFTRCGPQSSTVGFFYENGILTQDQNGIGQLYDINGDVAIGTDFRIVNLVDQTSIDVNFDNSLYYYEDTNQGKYVDSVAYFKTWKRSRVTNEYIGLEILKYDLRTQEKMEVSSSSDQLNIVGNYSNYHFKDNEYHGAMYSDNVFGMLDSMELYVHQEGLNVLVAKKNITNGWAYPFMDGIIYTADRNLYYWTEEYEILLDSWVFNVVIDRCVVAWTLFSGTKIKFYNGTELKSIKIPGKVSPPSLIIDENEFVYVDDSGPVENIIRGNHGLECYDSCNYPVLNIDKFYDASQFRSSGILSEALLEGGSEVIYQSIDSVILLPGFEIKESLSFRVDLFDCKNN